MLHVLLLVSLSSPAEAGKATQTFQTREGSTVQIKRKGRAFTSLDLTTGDKAEDISCSSFWDSTHYLRPVELSPLFKTAGTRAKDNEQQGDVLPFVISDAITDYWHVSPKMCALGITAHEGQVTVTVANLFKMNGRTFSLDPDTAEAVGAFIAETP